MEGTSRGPDRAKRADDATGQMCPASLLVCDQKRPARASAYLVVHSHQYRRRTVGVVCPCRGGAGELSRISKGRSKRTAAQVYLSQSTPGALTGGSNKVASEAGTCVVDNDTKCA